MHDDLTQWTLEWLYREQKRIKIALGNLESRKDTPEVEDGYQKLCRKQAVVEHLIDLAMKEVSPDD